MSHVITMGLRASVVVCVTSFLLGALFTHWIADSLTLWKSPVTDDHLWTATLYYTILAKFPPQIYYSLLAITLLGATTVVWSFRDGEAGNLMFDGGSIFLYGITMAMYMYSVIPSLLEKFSSVPQYELKDPFPQSLRSAVLDLASSNLICSVALTGVLALQAGRFWAETADDDAIIEENEEELKGRQSRAKTPSI